MNGLNEYTIYPLSESSLVIDLGNTIDEALNNKVLSMHQWFTQNPFAGLRDLVAAYSSLTILYDPFIINNRHHPAGNVFEFVKRKAITAWNEAADLDHLTGKHIDIPVCYDPEFGPDLMFAAAALQLTPEALVNLHASRSYRVFMLGFLPGFAYLGKLDRRLVLPRKSQPRQLVEAGSVGIAGWQTGIYPLQSPGGWQIIGRTPLKLFDRLLDPPVLLNAGDRVRFHAISREAFAHEDQNMAHHVN